jgi:hypothetical protein
MRMVADVLAAFERESDRVNVQIVDTGTSAGASDLERVTGLVAEYAEDDIARHRAALGRVAGAMPTIADELDRLAALLERSAREVGADVQRDLGTLRGVAMANREAVRAVEDAANHKISDTQIPAADDAQGAAFEPLLNARTAAAAMANWARSLRFEDANSEGALVAEMLATDADALVQRAGAAADTLARLGPLDPLLIARALREAPAVLVISPNGTTAIDLAALFPAAEQDASGAQLRFAGERLIATAIATLSIEAPPIVVIVHAEAERQLDAAGRPAGALTARLQNLLASLRQQRIDVAEWAVAQQPSKPTLAELNPRGDRPIVWFVAPAPTRLNMNTQGAAVDRAQRIGSLARAVELLLSEGEDMLFAVEPSELPATGDPDPITEPLAALGLDVDAGRPLIRRVPVRGGEAVWTYTELRRTAGQTPLASAFDGLAFVVQFATPMSIDPDAAASAGASVEPLYVVPADGDVWGESRWLAARYANVGRPFQPIALRTPITKDDRDNADGPWIVAATIERAAAATGDNGAVAGEPQRVVVVGAPEWFQRKYTHAAVTVQGRQALRYPGNAELFDASVFWLSGLEELVATGARTRDVPRIGPLSEAQMLAIRWGVVAGLPALVLAVGGALRVLRR